MEDSNPPATNPSSDPLDPKNLRILVAEDNAINQRLVTLMLGKLGHTVEVVSDGRQAVAALDKSQYDLVLLDVQMPVMDGLEAAAEICRRHPQESRPPLVALTANALIGDREKCLAAGMDGYLTKPIRIPELIATIKELLNPK